MDSNIFILYLVIVSISFVVMYGIAYFCHRYFTKKHIKSNHLENPNLIVLNDAIYNIKEVIKKTDSAENKILLKKSLKDIDTVMVRIYTMNLSCKNVT